MGRCDPSRDTRHHDSSAELKNLRPNQYGALPLLHPLSQDRSGRLRTLHIEAQDIVRFHVLLVDVRLQAIYVVAPFSSRNIELFDELCAKAVRSFGACVDETRE